MWSAMWLCHFNPFSIRFYNNISWSASCKLMTYELAHACCNTPLTWFLPSTRVNDLLQLHHSVSAVCREREKLCWLLLPVWPLWLILNFPMERIGSGIIKTGLMVWWWSLWIWGYRSFLWLASSRFLSYAGAESSTSSRRISRLSWCPHMRQTTNLLKQQAVNFQGMCAVVYWGILNINFDRVIPV